MNKKLLLAVLVLVLSIPFAVAAAQSSASSASIVEGFNRMFGWVPQFLESKTAVLGMMVFLLFFLLYGVISSALRKTPLFGGQQLDRTGKTVALSLSGIVVLSVFFVRNNAVEFAKTLAGAMNGFFALLFSGLVFLALKFTFKSEQYGELAGTKWEDVIAFIGFILSLRMFASLMEDSALKATAVSLSYLSIVALPIYLLLKNRSLKEPGKGMEHGSKIEQETLNDLGGTLKEFEQRQTSIEKLFERNKEFLELILKMADEKSPEKKAQILKQAESLIKGSQKAMSEQKGAVNAIKNKVKRVFGTLRKQLKSAEKLPPEQRTAELKKLQQALDAIKASAQASDKVDADLEQRKKLQEELFKHRDRLSAIVKELEKPEYKQVVGGMPQYTAKAKPLQDEMQVLITEIKNIAQQLGMKSRAVNDDISMLLSGLHKVLGDEIGRIGQEEKKRKEWDEYVHRLNYALARKGGAEAGQSLIHLAAINSEFFEKAVSSLCKKKATIEYGFAPNELKLGTLVGSALGEKGAYIVVKGPNGEKHEILVNSLKVLKINLH
jgi:ElaB/YqjD/DUF883 family membrane-anchored ribosome-binding protein